MAMTDPIADMLTKIRNANGARKEFVDVPRSRLILDIVRILKSEGFIDDFKFLDLDNWKYIRIFLKYTDEREAVVRGLKRVSTPGRRRYVGVKEIPHPFGGLGIAILSTSKGIMTDKQSRKEKVGGEVLCYVW